jgi:hypothetical protein
MLPFRSKGVVWFILVCVEKERKKRKKEIAIHAWKYI